MRKRWTLIAVMPIVASLLISGCGSGGGASGGSTNKGAQNSATGKVTTITFWNMWSGGDATAMANLVDEFNKTHKNIQVKVLSSQTPQKVLTAMTGGTPPDIAYTYHWWDIPEWSKVGALQSLNGYMQQSNLQASTFVPAAFKQSQYQGQTYGIPFTMDTMMLFYNKKLFQAAGISQPPQTTSEMQADAAKLTNKNQSGYTQVGFLPTYPYEVAGLWPYVFGASFYEPSSKTVTPDSQGNIEALKFEQSFYQSPYNLKQLEKFSSGFGARQSPDNPFFDGKLAMDVDGEWYPTFIKAHAPNLDYGVAPLPYPDGHPELKGAGEVNSGQLFIPAQSQHKQAAWTFIQWLISKGPYTQFCGEKGALPTTYAALDNPDLIKLDPGLQPFIKYVEGSNIKSFPVYPFSNQYIQAIGTEDSKVFNLQETPEQAAQKIKAEVQTLVN